MGNKTKNPIFRFFGKPYRYAIIFTFLLAFVFAYALFDAFVIPKEMSPQSAAEIVQPVPDNEEIPSPTAGGMQNAVTADNNPIIIGNSYKDINTEITIETIRAYDTDVYIADIKLSSVQHLKTAFAGDTYGRNITDKVSQMAEDNNAILAINGDYYGFRKSGWVLRNGTLYRSGGDEAFVLDAVGNMSCAASLAESNVSDLWQIWSFGPALVVDGEISVTESQEISGRSANSNPRTAIGQVGELHYIFIVSDGRTSGNKGLSLYQLADLFKKRGCSVAYNLDGGGSSTMVFNGEIINNPTSNGRRISEREVSDIVYIGY